jgi:hypothetical protein
LGLSLIPHGLRTTGTLQKVGLSAPSINGITSILIPFFNYSANAILTQSNFAVGIFFFGISSCLVFKSFLNKTG